MDRSAGPDEIDVSTLEEWLDGDGDVPFLLDVREPWEWEIANLGDRGATLIPLGELPDRLDEVPRDGVVVVYCRSGARSDRAAHFLRCQGIEGAVNLEGGILAWASEIDPSLDSY